MKKKTFLNMFPGQSNDLDFLGDSVEALDNLQQDFDWSQSGYFYRSVANIYNFFSFNWKELRPFMFGVPMRFEIQKQITEEVNTLSAKVMDSKPSDAVQAVLKDCVQTAYNVVAIKPMALLSPTSTWAAFIAGLVNLVPGLKQQSPVTVSDPRVPVQSSPTAPKNVPMLQFTRLVGETTPKLSAGGGNLHMGSKPSSMFGR